MNNKSNAVVMEGVTHNGSTYHYVEYDFFDEDMNETVKCKSAIMARSQAEAFAEDINNPSDDDFIS